MLEGKALLATLNCVLFFDCFAVLLYTIPQTFSEPWSAHGTSFCFVAIADLARSMQLNKGVKGAVAFFGEMLRLSSIVAVIVPVNKMPWVDKRLAAERS